VVVFLVMAIATYTLMERGEPLKENGDKHIWREKDDWKVVLAFCDMLDQTKGQNRSVWWRKNKHGSCVTHTTLSAKFLPRFGYKNVKWRETWLTNDHHSLAASKKEEEIMMNEFLIQRLIFFLFYFLFFWGVLLSPGAVWLVILADE
jgi:hypothetical protein